MTRYHRMTPEQKARRQAQVRAWQQANPDRMRLYQERIKGRKIARRRIYLDGGKQARYDIVLQAKLAIGKCVDCDFPCNEYTHVCFAWDHLDPTTKRFSLSKAVKHDPQEIIDEIAKCELVCHNCHAIRTWIEGHHLKQKRTQQTEQQQMALF